MFNLVSLLVAAALVSLQSDFQASGALLTNKLELDNNLQPNVASTPKRRTRAYVLFYQAPPETVRVVPGQLLELECEVYGAPIPTVTWLKNGEQIVDYEEEANEILAIDPTSVAGLTSKLLVTEVSDGDVYTCVASAGLKQKRASTTVYTLEGEEPDMLLQKLLIPPKPVITSYLNEVFQDFGTNLVLPCRVHGKAQLFWKDNRGHLVYEDSRIRILPSGNLLISDLRWTDMGQWSCIAQNSYGKDTGSTFVYPVKV